MSVLKIETHYITSIAVSPIQEATILVITHIETFNTDVIVFISKHYNVFDVTMTDNFQ